MYQFEPSQQSTIDTRVSDTPLLAASIDYTSGHIAIILSLPTNLPHENAFLCLEYDEVPCIDERKCPKRYRCKIKFPLIWL